MYVVTGCIMQVPTECMTLHNKVASYLHCLISSGLVTQKWYENVPETVINIEDTTLMWDMGIQLDQRIPVNRPDSVVHFKNEKQWQLIDLAIPDNNNSTTLREAEKLAKCKEVETDIGRMWGAKTGVHAASGQSSLH